MKLSTAVPLLFSTLSLGSVLPTTVEGPTLTSRQATKAVCVVSAASILPLPQIRAIARARRNELHSPPLIPNCFDLTVGPEAECLACQNAATVAYATALLECATVSSGCGPFEPLCAAGCIAAASFTLYGADQACYCSFANCADAAVKAKLGRPRIPDNIGGAVFNIAGGFQPGVTRTVVRSGVPSSCPVSG